MPYFRGRKFRRQKIGRSGQRASYFRFSGVKGYRKSLREFRNAVIIFLLKTAMWVGLFLFIFVGASALWYSHSLPDLNNLDKQSIYIPESTKIYDRSGKHLLYTIHGEENRTRVALSEVPNYMKWATIATEDKNFYTHKGYDIKGIARALVFDIKSLDISQGGSTITQQLVKNLILTREKSLARKVKELLLSYRIEKRFSKDEILELYLNQIPYGSNAYGIESATNTFFGKNTKDLTLAEAALLASLPKATTYYSPYGSHQDELLARQKHILKLMVDQGYITEDEAEAAKKEEFKFKARAEALVAPHFVIYVRELLAKKYGEGEIEQAGLKVTTTLDFEMQKIAEEAIKKANERNKKLGAFNASLVAIDPKTGQILAMVGSKDYFGETEPEGCTPGRNCKFEPNVNVALKPRQPGSSFKPMVYTAAFQKGYTPETIVYDVVTDFNNYEPKNFTEKEYGPVTLRKALAGSLNIPAVKTLYLTGLPNVLRLASEMGYTTFNQIDRYGLSFALGAGEVRLIEHVQAFGVLAAEGTRRDVTPILKVEDSQGAMLEEYEDHGVQVIDPQITHTTTSILTDNASRAYIFGKASPLILSDRPVAAKTGTTDDVRDAWTMGYTPSLSAGVWVGNNDNTPIKTSIATGAMLAAPIWNEFMHKSLRGKPVEQFPPYAPVKTGKPVLDGELPGQTKVKIDRASGKLATDLTPPSFIEERVVEVEPHDILHYVDPDDPRGPVPKNPRADPQYDNWERALKKWFEKNPDKRPKIGGEFPIDQDDVHIPENQPRVTITAPQDRIVFSQNSLPISIEANAPRGISRVEIYLEGNLKQTLISGPYIATIDFTELPQGPYKITTKAFDDVDNMGEASINIMLQRADGRGQAPGDGPGVPGPSPGAWPLPSLSFISPINNEVLNINSFPINVTIGVTQSPQIKRVNLYYNDASGNPIFINSVREPKSETLTISWDEPPPKGHYTVYAILINRDNKSLRRDIGLNVQ